MLLSRVVFGIPLKIILISSVMATTTKKSGSFVGKILDQQKYQIKDIFMKDLFSDLSKALSNLDVNCSNRKQVSEFVDFLYQDQPDTEKTADIKALRY